LADQRRYQLIVVGVSAGGLEALKHLLGALPANFPLPIVIVQHLRPDSGSTLAPCLQNSCTIPLKEAEEGERPLPGMIYLAPANYHLLVERDGTLALTVDPPVRYARPSIDVLFDSASDALGRALIGVILTGANDDGSAGLQRIRAGGGTTIVQDPADAEVPQMPLNALQAGGIDYVLQLARIPEVLCTLATTGGRQ